MKLKINIKEYELKKKRKWTVVEQVWRILLSYCEMTLA